MCCLKKSDSKALSYIELHEISGRATPDQLRDYKLSLQLYKTFNNATPTQTWIDLNESSVHTTRQTKFIISNENRLKVGWNILSHRFWNVNGKIDLDWLNLSVNSYKIKCKKIFL